METDVVIIGAGPAGATAAINLSPFRRVVVIDRLAEPANRMSESLAPAARRLLSDMGLWNDFLADGHSPRYATRSAWGSQVPDERDSLADIDGTGWLLDRKRFDARLRKTAIARGAKILAPARVVGLDRSMSHWTVKFECSSVTHSINARMILDCSGRSSQLLTPFGAIRQTHNRLICGWIHGSILENDSGQGISYTESAPEGWWYTAQMTDRRRLLAWHTDADLPSAAAVRTRSALLEKARQSTSLLNAISDTSFDGSEPPSVIAAHSSTLKPPAGENWLAAGDAAISFDPLSSQGLFNAIYTGLAAAEALDRALNGDQSAMGEYTERLGMIDAAYQSHLSAWYGLETRWMDQEFWRRRVKMALT